LVGIGLGEPFVGALLGTGLMVGAIDEAILVDVHLVEMRSQLGFAGGRFGAADTAVLVGVQPGHHSMLAMAVLAEAATVAARHFLFRQLAVLVLVQLVEFSGQARMLGRFAAVDIAIAIGIEPGARRV